MCSREKLYKKTKLRFCELDDNAWLMAVPKEKHQKRLRDYYDPTICSNLVIVNNEPTVVLDKMSCRYCKIFSEISSFEKSLDKTIL